MLRYVLEQEIRHLDLLWSRTCFTFIPCPLVFVHEEENISNDDRKEDEDDDTNFANKGTLSGKIVCICS
jgi:hypothetical protein